MVDSDRIIRARDKSAAVCGALGEFFEQFSEARKEFNGKILREIECREEYERVLREFLGGVGSGYEENESTLIKLLWKFYRGAAEDCAPICWSVIQHYSPYHKDQIWSARHPRAGKNEEDKKTDDFGVYLCRLNDWYYDRTRAETGGIAGFFNLLLRPDYLRAPLAKDDHWMPRSVVFCRTDPPIRTTLHRETQVVLLKELIEVVAGDIDSLREELKAVPQEAFASLLDGHLREICRRNGAYIGAFKTKLADVIREQTLTKDFDGKVFNEEGWDWRLFGTLAFILLHPEKWEYYYYFTVQGAPDTAGTAVVIATEMALSPELEVCIQDVTNVIGGSLTLVETRAMEEREARRMMAYFANLHAHSLTKQFTTPMYNETMTMPLEESARDLDVVRECVQRLQTQLKRFEHVMQSGQQLGVGTRAHYVSGTDRVKCSDLLSDLCTYGEHRIVFRYNDLYDDPRYSQFSPERATEYGDLWRRLVEEPICPDDPSDVIYVHESLLLYHLQSLIQNGVEAFKLADAADRNKEGDHSRERIAIWYRPPREDKPTFEIEIANDGASVPSQVVDEVRKWQAELTNPNVQQARWPQLSTKSGGHTGSGLLLAAAYVRALKKKDGSRVGELRFREKEEMPDFEGRRFAASVIVELPASSSDDGSDIVLDQTVLRRVPNNTYRRSPRMTPLPEEQGGTDIERLPRNINFLIVEDDTADRRRFRLFFEQQSDPGQYIFAWDAKQEKVWSCDVIVRVLERCPACTLFLDLAWSRYDELVCDELRAGKDESEFTKMLSEYPRKPGGLDLLEKMQANKSVNNDVVIVTAYRFPLMEELCKKSYTKGLRKVFQKWPDETDFYHYLE